MSSKSCFKCYSANCSKEYFDILKAHEKCICKRAHEFNSFLLIIGINFMNSNPQILMKKVSKNNFLYKFSKLWDSNILKRTLKALF